MSLYTLKHLLDDCSARRTRTACASDRKRETLEEVWRALNDWIDSRFSQGKVRVVSVSLDTLSACACVCVWWLHVHGG